MSNLNKIHQQLYADVLHILTTAREKTYIAINSEMVQAYWHLGKRIVEEICYALRSNLNWTHHRLIMRVENVDARNYYLKECVNQLLKSKRKCA